MLSVLLIDENAYSRDTLDKLFKRELSDIRLQAYSHDSLDIVSILEENDFSFVILRIYGTYVNQLLLCEKIRQISQVPIILIGDRYDYQLMRKAMFYQVNDYLLDPVRPGELGESIRRISAEQAPQMLSDHPQHEEQAQTTIIDDIKKYVQKELRHNVTLKEISHLFHFNSAYLGQKFKSQVNMSFNEYLLQQRMERAKSLLENTEMRIYEVAREVGYSEIDWFYKKFKEYTGTSANEYRKQASITA